MNLTLFFKLITGVIFQSQVLNYFYHPLKGSIDTAEKGYDSVYFYCPRVVAKDGMSVSLQISRGNYALSDKGYRKYSLNWENVEFGYSQYLTTEDAEILASNGINIEDNCFSVPIPVMEKIFALHGGIDWEKTIEGVNNL